jgi:glutamine cyclotransferase
VGNDVALGSPIIPSATSTIVPSVISSRTLSPTASATLSPTASRTPPPTQTSTPTLTAPTTPTALRNGEPSPTVGVLEHALGTGAVPVYTYRVVNVYPHDPGAYTQGLVYEDGIFYEGTGLRGRSSLRKVDLETGQVLQFLPLADLYFGEGIAVLADDIYQLTWKSGIGLVYDKDSFGLLRVFTYPGEGWGLTHDGQRLVMSDGTPALRFLDPETLQETGQVKVSYEGRPVWALNELEYVKGEIYANIWKTNTIARIDPKTGKVIGLIDLEGLLEPQGYDGPVDVLNGIAYDAKGNRLFVTGKLWPMLFEIELVPQEQVYLPILVLDADAAVANHLGW